MTSEEEEKNLLKYIDIVCYEKKTVGLDGTPMKRSLNKIQEILFFLCVSCAMFCNNYKES